MPREPQPFEQDFLLVTDTEMRVRQATQYAQLDMAILATRPEEVWEWDTGDLDDERPVNERIEEEYGTFWQSMLERL
jgi:hypothetical protein